MQITADSADTPARLKLAMVGCLVGSIGHLTHNVAFFDAYPEPAWLDARWLDLWSVVAVASLIVGYLQWQRVARKTGGRSMLGLCLMLVFLISSLLVVMHYRYDGASEMSFVMHALIWLQFLPTLWLGRELARSWRRLSSN